MLHPTLIFILGVIIGSILNVYIHRIPANQSAALSPSYCTNCKTRLKSVNLIPILSHLFCKGRCKYCDKQIPLQYPFIEILNGFIYLLIFTAFGCSINFIFVSVLSSLLIVISVIDYRYTIIPNRLVMFGLITGLIYRFILPSFLGFDSLWSDGVLGLLIGGGFFLLVSIIFNNGMGGGDIKLMGMLGFFIGTNKIIMVIFLSFFIGTLFALPLLLFKKKSRKETIPFGPFIAVSTLITMLYYYEILNLYLEILS